MKVWDRTGIELVTPGSAVSFTSVARHVTDCATQPSILNKPILYLAVKLMHIKNKYIEGIYFLR